MNALAAEWSSRQFHHLRVAGCGEEGHSMPEFVNAERLKSRPAASAGLGSDH